MIKSIARVITVGLAVYAGFVLYSMWGAAVGGGIAVIGTWK